MDLIKSIDILVKQGVAANQLEIVAALKELVDLMKTERHRAAVSLPPRDFYVMFAAWAPHLLALESHLVALEAFRCLRNSLAFSCDNQDLLRGTTNLIQLTVDFLRSHSQSDHIDTELSALLQVILQFLNNAVVGNISNAKLVAAGISNYIGKLLLKNIKGAAYLVNTILNSVPEFSEAFSDPLYFQALLDDEASEGCLLCLETLASNAYFLSERYEALPKEQRILYLKFLTSSACKKNVEFFCQEFQKKADNIMKSEVKCISSNFQEAYLLTQLMSSLCEPAEIQTLQNEEAAVLTAIHLLIMADCSEEFAAVRKLAHVSADDINHPAFMFKAHLIRLLGNLAYRNLQNQILIGESCIPIILNCTQMDNLNPFITQWAVLAIRNLLEDNETNQSVVRRLQPSHAFAATALSEYGISLEFKYN